MVIDLLESVERAGHRLTSARRLLLLAVIERTEGFTAEELASRFPDVGRATVYRTLRLLVGLGLVCKMALPDGGPRYTLAGQGHHHHSLCVRCGAVEEFRDGLLEQILRNWHGEVGQIVGHRIEVYVVCRQCAPQGQSVQRR